MTQVPLHKRVPRCDEYVARQALPRRAHLRHDRAMPVARGWGGASDDAETLSYYIREIGKFPRLTPEEEKGLGCRIRQGDEDALRRLVECNLRFGVSYAKCFRGFGLSFLDLIHEGNLGLIQAACRFDPDRNVTFIKLLTELGPKESEVVRLCFGLDGEEPQTLHEIGDRLQLSWERIRQIQSKAIAKLRRSNTAQAMRGFLN